MKELTEISTPFGLAKDLYYLHLNCSHLNLEAMWEGLGSMAATVFRCRELTLFVAP